MGRLLFRPLREVHEHDAPAARAEHPIRSDRGLLASQAIDSFRETGGAEINTTLHRNGRSENHANAGVFCNQHATEVTVVGRLPWSVLIKVANLCRVSSSATPSSWHRIDTNVDMTRETHRLSLHVLRHLTLACGGGFSSQPSRNHLRKSCCTPVCSVPCVKLRYPSLLLLLEQRLALGPPRPQRHQRNIQSTMALHDQFFHTGPGCSLYIFLLSSISSILPDSNTCFRNILNLIRLSCASPISSNLSKRLFSKS